MSNGNRDENYNQNANAPKKADIILQIDREISQKVDNLSASVQNNNQKLEAAICNFVNSVANTYSAQLTEIYESLHEECIAIKREMRYLAAQNENIFLNLSQKLQELSSAESSGASAHNAESVPVAASAQIDYDKLAAKVAELMPKQNAVPASVAAPAQIDYDELAAKVAEHLPVQEYISPDYIASKVAEQIVIPEAVETEQVAPQQATSAKKKVASAPVAAPVPVDLQLDEDELADRIALKVGGIKAEDFDIIVDDDGCSSISNSIVEKLDYEVIAYSIAEKLRVALEYIADKEPDYEEMATRISEKITVAGVNEEAIADKAAAVISEHIPEIDTDEIADKVVSQLVGNMPSAEVDSEEICKNISERLIETQENNDYDIVIDEEGLDKITDYVSEEIRKTSITRFDEIEKQISEIKAMLASGAVLVAADKYEQKYTAEEVAEDAEDNTLVTVSGETDSIEQSDEYNEELAELVEEIDEVPVEGEITGEDLDEAEGGVDFENMMKFNRSFIARIIQSTDEQKEYYGRVKTALLSYAKVNSNMAWGAERFNKGRETIARFKIRGKTLCLYLALNPADYEYSVYHHFDVSDNKSMHGTPMMVKIKSPRGAKKAIRLIDQMLEQRGGVKRNKSFERNYAAMYPYESMEQLIEDGLVKDLRKNK